MDRSDLYRLLSNNFGFTPTKDQSTVLYHLSAFLLTQKERPVYLLKGYAGTGKTSLVSTLVKTIPQIGMNYQLLAPTGRAAKIMSKYTAATALTLHRKLYRFQVLADGELRMTKARNESKNTVYIVDECSMVSGNILDDLIEYVFSGSCCKLLLIGDSAQLPPVGLEISPAMDFDILRNSFCLTIATYEMKEVMRQALNSGILHNATNLRNIMSADSCQPAAISYKLPLLDINDFSDIEKIDPMTFEELLWQSFGDKRSCNEAVIVCRSNKRANMFNQAIRSRVLQDEGELSAGEKLMVVKNNYFWSDQLSEISGEPSSDPRNSQILKNGFIANGDMVEVLRINKMEEMYGFHFADVDIQMLDYEEMPTLSVKILMETLHSDSPALTEEESKKLYKAVEEDYLDIPRASDRRKLMKNNPYFNALQVKYGYALSCHKTQGGQWSNIFVEAPYLAEEKNPELSDMRWLYTALTRASKKIYLVNFKNEWFV